MENQTCFNIKDIQVKESELKELWKIIQINGF